MDDLSAKNSYFPDSNYARILLLSALIKALKSYVIIIYTGVVFEIGGLPHGWKWNEFLNAHLIPFIVSIPSSIIALSYWAGKCGIKKVIKNAIYIYSVLIVLLSLSKDYKQLTRVLLPLGMTVGLDAIVYGIIAMVYRAQYQSFAFALLFLDSSLYKYLVFDLVVAFDYLKLYIPNWFVGKLLVLQYPQLVASLSLAATLVIIAYKIDLLLPKEIKENNSQLPVHTSEERQVLVNSLNQTNYNSISGYLNILHNNYTQLTQNQTCLLIISFILNQLLVRSAIQSLTEWYRASPNMGGLSMGYEIVFPGLYYAFWIAYYVIYLCFIIPFNRYEPSLIYYYTYNVSSFGLCYLIMLNFLYNILPSYLLNILVGLGGLFLLVCSSYSNLSSTLMIAKLKSKHSTLFLFGLGIGGYKFIEIINEVSNNVSLFQMFANMEISFFQSLNPSLVVFLITALINRRLAYRLHSYSES